MCIFSAEREREESSIDSLVFGSVSEGGRRRTRGLCFFDTEEDADGNDEEAVR